MSPRRIYGIFLRQMYLFRGNFSRWLLVFFWSTADLLIWGFLTIYLNSIGGAEFNFVTVLIGAVIFYNFITRSQNGFSVSSMEDVWSKNFLNIFSTPLSIKEYVVGLMLVSVVTTAASLTVMGVLAEVFFRYHLLQFGWLIVPYLANLFLFGSALGLIGLAVVIRFGPSAETISWLASTALAPFSGIFYPVSVLPGFLQVVAHLIPTSYVFEGMRSVVLGGSFNANNLIIGLVLSAVYLVLSYFLLYYTYRQAIKRGLFARFLSDAW